MTTFSSSDDIISVEDITNRVDELREELQEACEDQSSENDFYTWLTEQANNESSVFNESAIELVQLEELLSDMCGYGGDHQWEGDWYPATLIAEGYFTEYAEDFAIDIGAVKRDAPWPNTHIDWEAAAEDLKSDYSEVDFNGSTYFYRG